MMKTVTYQVSFVTPAFLGNAEQSGQWRTPPFKALLRQWWRVAAAPQFDYDHRKLREAEGRLFGHAWLEGDKDRKGNKATARKSLVHIRLDNWMQGKQKPSDWSGRHFERVTTTKNGKGKVRADLYLGFGAVLPPSKKENRQRIELHRNALKPTEQGTLKLRLPAEHEETIQSVMTLIQLFGSLGSRARNGWGSLDLGMDIGLDEKTLAPFSRPWTDCLELDWPHALGRDANNNLLIWVTQPVEDWRAALNALAHIKVGIRAEAKKFRDHSKIGGVHLLGYPAGKDWKLVEFAKDVPHPGDQEARLATQMRFKVMQTPDGFVGVVYHLPAKLPDVLRARLNRKQTAWLEANERKVWQAIHHYLDNRNDTLSRLGA
ncbi:MAG: hypothetical protein JXR29_01150 [Methylothermaceae bacterium]|nr:hypothetical protein [Methylothermaceae bacterium]